MNGRAMIGLAVAVVAALAAVTATVVVGASVREDTVVAHPYEAGLHHGAREVACDVRVSRCTLPLDGGGEVSLELGPHPVRTMRELAVRADVRGAGEGEGPAVSVSFAMDGMDMGENAVRLAPVSAGAWSGKAVLVRCPSGRKDWTADVSVRRPGAAPRSARFRFTVED